MASAESTEDKLSACCISHQFQKAATEYPETIAVIHASGFAQIAREFHRNYNSDQLTDGDNDEFISGEKPSSSHPPCYEGDQCFTFSDILSAVENLSCRLRRILDGADDPYLVKSHPVNISSKKSEFVQVSEALKSSSRSLLQHSTKFRNTYTPKVIGIFMEPSVEYIVSVLSILRCGEAFMPLDPTWPKSRILSVVSLSKADLIIGCESSICGNCCHRLDTIQWLIDDGNCRVLSISMTNYIKDQCHSSPLTWPCESENIRSFCYLIYTSGSTGKPKGVCGTEIGLLNRFLWMQEMYPLHEGDLLLFKTPISFIDHLQELLGALLASCTLVIPPFNQLREKIFYIVDFLQGYFISRLVAVPSLMRAILPALQSLYYARVQGSLKLIVLSGEVFHLSLWEKLVKLLPQTTILNLYGSTEVTGDCTYFDCKRLSLILENETLGSVPIGLPISNCDVVLFGENGTNQGEIYVGGHCIAAGYFCYPYLMPLELVELPPNNHVGAPSSISQYYFKTGDFAKKLLGGDLVFIGRKDRTIKVNGQRIALEEIENAFREHPDVVDAAVICCEVEGEILLLEAYLVTEKGDTQGETLKSSIRSWISCKLPQTMIPSHIFFTSSLPLSSSGKVDYLTLAGCSTYSNRRSMNEVEENPLDSLTQVIKKVFSDALMVEKISDDDDFFEMGGNSISAAYASFKLGIHMKFLYTFPTPQKLQMGLLSSSYNVRTDSHLGLDLRKSGGDILSFSESRILGFHGSKPLASLHMSDNERDACKPCKRLKAKPILYSDSTESRLRDEDSSNPSPIHFACSFSRCNKVVHGGQCEGNTFCHEVWSNEIPRERGGFMQELWKVDMESCVDASPLIVFKESNIYLFIGSHSHKFTCIDAKSGIVCWETKLQGRVECSAAILDNFSQIVVGCYEGIIYFLDFSSGSVCWNFQTHGEVKSQPVIDKCRNLVWCGSYDHYLYAIDYKSYRCAYKLQCGGSIFGSPAIDEEQEKLYVASTSGHVTALLIKAKPFNKLWIQDLGAPIFGSLSINLSSGSVICCLVDGTVVALNTCGSIIWKGRTSGPNFAGPCISKSLPSQVLVCSRDGSIYSFEMEKGNLLWQHAIGHPITSSPYVDENLQLVSDVSQLSDRLICVCDSSGCIWVLLIDSYSLGDLNKNKKYRVEEFARLNLEGDIFSSPVMIGGKIFVGCRDNHVYCIELRSKYEPNHEVSFCC